jgi:nitroimidazol reductase NimA-like FMN-containing flavoprotein (pyridoxamine 5'-phosphate oxidase superfamily)
MPSRRQLISMTDDEVKDYVQSAQTLIIVSNGPTGYPHPMPMWFYADDEGCLYCTTFEKSQKVLNFTRDPKAACLVESGTAYSELKSVLIYAHAEIVRDRDAVVDTLVNINSKGRELDDEERAKLREAVQKTAEKRIAIKFTPEKYVTWDHSKLGGKY